MDESEFTGRMGIVQLSSVFTMMSHYGGFIYNEGWVEHQKIGWDVIVWTSPDKYLTVEVKSSQKASMSYGLFEDYKASGTKLGWVNTIKSDLLCCVYLMDCVAYIVKFDVFKPWYDKNRSRFKTAPWFDEKSGMFNVLTRVPWKIIERELGKENIGKIIITEFIISVWLTLKRMGLWNYGPAHGMRPHEVLKSLDDSTRRAIHNYKYDPESIRSQNGGLIFF